MPVYFRVVCVVILFSLRILHYTAVVSLFCFPLYFFGCIHASGTLSLRNYAHSNFFREQQLAPDGTEDGYKEICNLPGPPPYAPCPPCQGVARKDGTPACNIDKSKGFSTASVQGWGFIGPHGLAGSPGDPFDVTRMVAAVVKYGPAQIGIDASCLSGYTSGIITNCTSNNVDHAVAIVGAGTDPASNIDYWLVRNSWNTTFGMDGYFKMQRDTNQMGVFGGYFGCYDKDCMVDP